MNFFETAWETGLVRLNNETNRQNKGTVNKRNGTRRVVAQEKQARGHHKQAHGRHGH